MVGERRFGLVIGLAVLATMLLGSGMARASGPTVVGSGQPVTEVPGEFVIEDFIVFVDEDGTIWIKLYPSIPWDATPPSEWFSDYVQFTVAEQGSNELPPMVASRLTTESPKPSPEPDRRRVRRSRVT